MEKFTEHFTVTDNMCRPKIGLASVGILDLFQSIAGEHISKLGYPFSFLAQKGLAFVLVRCKYEIYDVIRPYEKLKIITWPHKANRFEFDRSYAIYRDDILVGKGLSKWVIINLNTRSLVRPDVIDLALFGNLESEAFPKIKLPMLNYEKIMTYEVRNDDIDVVGHFNNTKYANVLLDVNYDALEINYLKELKLGNSVDVFLASDLTHDYYLGKIGEVTHFIIKGRRNIE